MPELPPPSLNPQRPIDWRTLRLWQIQPLRDLAVLVAIVGVLYLGKLLSVVTVPILLAMLLAYLFEPVVRWLISFRSFSRQGAAVAIIVAVGVLIVGPVVLGAGFAVVQGTAFAQRTTQNVLRLADAVGKPEDAALVERLPSDSWRRLAGKLINLRTEAEKARAREAGGGGATAAPQTESDFFESEAAQEMADQTTLQVYRAVESAFDWVKNAAPTIGKQALSTGVSALEVVLNWVMRLGYLIFGGFLTAFFFFFFCTGYGKVLGFWERLIPERRRSATFQMVAQMDVVISGFVRGRLTIGAILIVYYTVGYWLIGVPAPLILGPIAGVLSLVPYAAFIVGAPTAMILLWLGPNLFDWQSAAWWVLAGPLIVHGLSQVLDDYILTPSIQGKSTGMDTPTILFASLAGAVLAGFYGLLVAIPVAACIRILLIHTVWPRVQEWAEGKARDPLPISRV